MGVWEESMIEDMVAELAWLLGQWWFWLGVIMVSVLYWYLGM